MAPGDQSRLDIKLDQLAASVNSGFERITNALAIKIDRHELDQYVRKDAYDERGKRVDGELSTLRRDLDDRDHRDERDEDHRVQAGFIKQSQRYWWVPIGIVLLKPDLLHGLAILLGYHS